MNTTSGVAEREYKEVGNESEREDWGNICEDNSVAMVGEKRENTSENVTMWYNV